MPIHLVHTQIKDETSADAKASTDSHQTQQDGLIRVAIVDDSVVVRGLISRWLREVDGIDVVGTYRSGREIITNIVAANPDVVILDIEMADIDGITALPYIMRSKPNVIVIIASTLTARNADISFKCMALGAKDYVLKPQSNREVSTSDEFKNVLIEKIFALGDKDGKKALLRRQLAPQIPSAQRAPILKVQSTIVKPALEMPAMRPFSRTPPKLLLIGASTGGPQAVMNLLKGISSAIARYPVLIAQHMPAAFTLMFAEHLTRQTQLDVVQATDGEILKSGRVYVAPGGRHMAVSQHNGYNQISIIDGAPVNFCKPSVDVLFESCAKFFGPACLSVILTGMGVDGAKGALKIADVGGSVIVQDEDSSVVWGMPGATVKIGACAAILSVEQMAPVLMRLLAQNKPYGGME